MQIYKLLIEPVKIKFDGDKAAGSCIIVFGTLELLVRRFEPGIYSFETCRFAAHSLTYHPTLNKTSYKKKVEKTIYDRL